MLPGIIQTVEILACDFHSLLVVCLTDFSCKVCGIIFSVVKFSSVIALFNTVANSS